MNYLTEIEELGIKIIALIHQGLLDANESGIDLRVRVTEDLHTEFDYQLSGKAYEYIPGAVIDFIDERFYLETYPGAAPTYDKVNLRFWLATKYYTTMMNKLEPMKQKQAETQQKYAQSKQKNSKVLNHFNKT